MCKDCIFSKESEHSGVCEFCRHGEKFHMLFENPHTYEVEDFIDDDDLPF